MPDETRARRLILGPIALIASLLIILTIYLLARNRTRNHGPVESEADFWAKHGGVPRPYTGGSYRRHHD